MQEESVVVIDSIAPVVYVSDMTMTMRVDSGCICLSGLVKKCQDSQRVNPIAWSKLVNFACGSCSRRALCCSPSTWLGAHFTIFENCCSYYAVLTAGVRYSQNDHPAMLGSS